MQLLFSTAVFAGAALLFLVQPMLGKLVLPSFGGAPAVWTTCMLYFQGMLLAGYAYAHVLTRMPSRTAQWGLHAAACAAALLLPVAAPGRGLPADGGSPTLALLGQLGRGAGLPVFVVATTGPLLQRWFSFTKASDATDPYVFYATGNAASLLALAAYPFVIERWVPLGRQASLWMGAFTGYAALVVACGLCMGRPGRLRPSEPEAPPTPLPAARWLTWAALAAAPSSLSLATTQFLAADVAAAPLLWILPLGVYLLTWILAFSPRVRVAARWPALGFGCSSLAVAVSQFAGWPLSVELSVGLHLAQLLFAGWVCHGRVAADRPPPDRLTAFYLSLSFGGLIGAAANALVAPWLFNWVWEYPLAIAGTCLLLPAGPAHRRIVPRGAAVGLALAVSLLWAVGPALRAYPGRLLHRERSFFGVHSVLESPDGGFQTLWHGATIHGVQRIRPPSALRREPLAYYHTQGPLGWLFHVSRGGGAGRPAPGSGLRRVAVVGMGAGTLAAYSRPGDEYTFYEIDPAVDRIARDPRLFTFLRDAAGSVRTVLGDGRLKIAEAPDGGFDLIVLDAFSGDSVPCHLLTVEAFDLYLRKLAPQGLLAVHTSNRYLDVTSVVGDVAARLRVPALVCTSLVTAAQADEARMPSQWAVLSRSAQALGAVEQTGPWELPSGDALAAWTDDRTNLAARLRW